MKGNGTHLVRVLEVTERLHAPDRKRVQAKDVVPALESEDALEREYTELTGKEVPEAFKNLNLRKIVPDKIREKLETVELVTYQQNRDYAIKQARTARNERAATDTSPTVDAATKEDSDKDPQDRQLPVHP